MIGVSRAVEVHKHRAVQGIVIEMESVGTDGHMGEVLAIADVVRGLRRAAAGDGLAGAQPGAVVGEGDGRCFVLFDHVRPERSYSVRVVRLILLSSTRAAFPRAS